MGSSGLKNFLSELPQRIVRKPSQRVTTYSPLGEAIECNSPDLFKFNHSIPKNSMIGRDHIQHPTFQADPSISRQHAKLDEYGNLQDLNSTNGTRVNGTRIHAITQLKKHDVVHFGTGDCYYEFDGKQLLPRQTIHIGRDTESQIQANRMDIWMSRQHIKLTPDGLLTDLKSQTGTFVDGHRIQRSHQLQNGSIVQLGNSGLSNYYYSYGKLIPLTPKKADLLRQLFPNGLANCEFKQGQFGNCTFLASLKSILKNNPAKLIEKIEPLPDNRVKLSFPGTHNPSIEMDLSDYKHSGVRGPIGVRLLETAFVRSLKPYSTINSVEILNQGGLTHEALKALHHGKEPITLYNGGKPLIQQSKQGIQKTLDILNRIARDPANHIAVTSSGFNNPQLGLIANHAYSLVKVDTPKMLVTLANPHDTQKVMQLTFKDYFNNLRGLTVSKP